MSTPSLSTEMTMSEILAVLPGARRALFAGFHIGGCQSCGYAEEDTLKEVAAKHGKDADEILAHLRQSHQEDLKLQISADDLRARLKREDDLRVIDLRKQDDYEAGHIDGAALINEDLAEEIMTWPKDTAIVMYCGNGLGSLNAVAYMASYGFTNVRCLAGGYAAWSQATSSSGRKA